MNRGGLTCPIARASAYCNIIDSLGDRAGPEEIGGQGLRLGLIPAPLIIIILLAPGHGISTVNVVCRALRCSRCLRPRFGQGGRILTHGNGVTLCLEFLDLVCAGFIIKRNSIDFFLRGLAIGRDGFDNPVRTRDIIGGNRNCFRTACILRYGHESVILDDLPACRRDSWQGQKAVAA